MNTRPELQSPSCHRQELTSLPNPDSNLGSGQWEVLSEIEVSSYQTEPICDK